MSENDKVEDTESTTEATTEESVVEESTTAEETVEESKPEVKESVEEKVTTTEKTEITKSTGMTVSLDSAKLSVSAGTGLTVFNGSCPKCGARIANGIVKDEKVNCPTCKQDF